MNTLVIIGALSVLCCVYAQSYRRERQRFDNDMFDRFSGSGRHLESGRFRDSGRQFRSGGEFDSGRHIGSGRHFETGHRLGSGRQFDRLGSGHLTRGDGLFRRMGDRDYRPSVSRHIPRRSIIRDSY
ncbi:uncharacterized protein LOC132728636 [Ruditapes philippinarum]|uniref:uncharacterized protein LOC132728636 n=1 Tax=Ruditapes philippinarum TaxID=129788 RepID=UPI00295B9841|nr:uncharacterized protein LOC132728636 [Ruditapes philippinarum]